MAKKIHDSLREKNKNLYNKSMDPFYNIPFYLSCSVSSKAGSDCYEMLYLCVFVQKVKYNIDILSNRLKAIVKSFFSARKAEYGDAILNELKEVYDKLTE